MNKFFHIFFISITTLSLSACKNSDKKPQARMVKLGTVEQKEVPIYVDAIGQVISPVTVNVRPQAAGKLIKANIQQGDFVKEGDVLYEIDPRPYIALLEQAKAQLAQDEALYKYADQAVTRYKKVVEEDYISVLNYEQLESTSAAALAKVNLDKAAVDAAALNLSFTKVIAPVTGKISFFNVDVGNILVVDDPIQITTIKPISPIDIQFSLPQQQFELIRQVQGDSGKWKFVATLPESDQKKFEGTTFFLDNQLDQNTGTILLKGRVSNDEQLLWPGEFVRVKVLYDNALNAFLVSPGAILMGREGAYIYTVDSENKAISHNVKVLTRNDEYIAFRSESVKEGDRVIIDGQLNVAPGIKVTEAPLQKS